MSGTSLDGIDVALIETDGFDYVRPLDFHYVPYTAEERAAIRPCFGQKDRSHEKVLAAEELITIRHADAVLELLDKVQKNPSQIDFIGFHGQTIYHAPKDSITIQIGDGALLAEKAGVDVVYDFRSHDVSAGGEGAPLAPVYHKALAKSAKLSLPVVFLNIGGVANISWVGAGEEDLIAFDTGPGNALIDDWMARRTGERFDKHGIYASQGEVLHEYLDEWLAHPYFTQKPPKSLDRDEWDIAALGKVVTDLDDISIEDGAATLAEFTVQGIIKSLEYMPEKPAAWYAAGGGRHNRTIMKRLAEELEAHDAGALYPIDDLGWNGDAIEAECFAYLAVRSYLEEPISYPLTTGVPKPLTGGILQKAKK